MSYQIKANLMLHALKNDFFGYGTIVEKRKDKKYKIIVDGEVYYDTLHRLAWEWDQLEEDDQLAIAESWVRDQH